MTIMYDDHSVSVSNLSTAQVDTLVKVIDQFIASQFEIKSRKSSKEVEEQFDEFFGVLLGDVSKSDPFYGFFNTSGNDLSQTELAELLGNSVHMKSL